MTILSQVVCITSLLLVEILENVSSFLSFFQSVKGEAKYTGKSEKISRLIMVLFVQRIHLYSVHHHSADPQLMFTAVNSPATSNRVSTTTHRLQTPFWVLLSVYKFINIDGQDDILNQSLHTPLVGPSLNSPDEMEQDPSVEFQQSSSPQALLPFPTDLPTTPSSTRASPSVTSLDENIRDKHDDASNTKQTIYEPSDLIDAEEDSVLQRLKGYQKQVMHGSYRLEFVFSKYQSKYELMSIEWNIYSRGQVNS